ALLVGITGVERVALAREIAIVDPDSRPASATASQRPRIHIAQATASGEGGRGEGGGQVLGSITEFRLSSNDPAAFDYDAAHQVAAYTDLVAASYAAALQAAEALRTSVDALSTAPDRETLQAARE